MQFKLFYNSGFHIAVASIRVSNLLLVSNHFWLQQMDIFPCNYEFTLPCLYLLFAGCYAFVLQCLAGADETSFFSFISFPFPVTFHKIGSHHMNVFRTRGRYPEFPEHTFSIAWRLFPATDAAEFPKSLMLEGMPLLSGSPAEEQTPLCFQFRCWKLFGAAVKLAHLTSLPNYFQTLRSSFQACCI